MTFTSLNLAGELQKKSVQAFFGLETLEPTFRTLSSGFSIFAATDLVN